MGPGGILKLDLTRWVIAVLVALYFPGCVLTLNKAQRLPFKGIIFCHRFWVFNTIAFQWRKKARERSCASRRPLAKMETALPCELTDQLDGKTYCSALGKRSHVPLGPVSGMQAQLREHMEKAFHPMWGFFLGQCKLGRIGGWYSPEIQCQEAKEWDSLPHFYGIWWVKGTVLHPWGIKRWIRHSR